MAPDFRKACLGSDLLRVPLSLQSDGRSPVKSKSVLSVTARRLFLVVDNSPICTLAIIGVNCVVYGIVSYRGDSSVALMDRLISYGANYAPRTTDGQTWRLLTSTFLHGNCLHLLTNLWVLLFVGRVAEKVLGRPAFTLGYLVSGIFGSLASAIFHPHAVCVGASGAIFGAFGMLLGFLVSCGDVPLRKRHGGFCAFYLCVLSSNVLLTWRVANIDQAAHLSGFAAGMLIGLILGQSQSAEVFSKTKRPAVVNPTTANCA